MYNLNNLKNPNSLYLPAWLILHVKKRIILLKTNAILNHLLETRI